MINTKLDFSTAPEFIQQFENDNIGELKKLQFYNWPLWQIVKVPVFYRLLQADNNQEVFSLQAQKNNHKIVNAYNEIANFLKIVSGGSKKGSVLCITHYADCLSRKGGKFYNSLFDYIVSKKKDYSICHWEYTNATKKPRFNEPEVKIQVAESFFSRINKSSVIISPATRQQFLDILNTYALSKNIDVSAINEEFINGICISFYHSYRFWKLAFKRKKPSKIFSSEKMGTGILAAANELRIPFYEFQHGNIDKNYPPYIWNEAWNKVQNNIKPDYLIVFGQTAKKAILADNFFNEDKVIAVGYEKIENYRFQKAPEKDYIFFALQPMMHELNKAIIACIKVLSGNHKIAIKYHPLQLQKEIDEYELLLQGSNVTFFDKTKNIYDCILESKIIVSHVSTVLEEALSLGKVSVTIATENLPAGIHSMTGNLGLQEAIIPISIKELPAFLEKISIDDIFFANVLNKVQRFQFEIYRSGYYDNISQLIQNQK